MGTGSPTCRFPTSSRRFARAARWRCSSRCGHEFNAHLVSADADGTVTRIQDMSVSDVRINGGFFAFRREILDWIEPGDELVEETFGRLIPRGEIGVYRYDGFFGPMDTIKDRQRLEKLYEGGSAPWHVVARDAEPIDIGYAG